MFPLTLRLYRHNVFPESPILIFIEKPRRKLSAKKRRVVSRFSREREEEVDAQNPHDRQPTTNWS